MIAQQFVVERTREKIMVVSTYLRPRAAAKQIGVSLSTILRLVDEGALPATRLRQKIILIAEEDIAAMLDNARTGKDACPRHTPEKDGCACSTGKSCDRACTATQGGAR